MALINCPECNKEVSDKATNCIHCGYPLQSNNMCKVNGVAHDLSFVLDDNCGMLDKVCRMVQISQSDNCAVGAAIDKIIAENKIPEFLNIPRKMEPNTPKCPTCGSTKLEKISTAGKVAKVGIFGLMGAGTLGKTWRCKNCGSKF